MIVICVEDSWRAADNIIIPASEKPVKDCLYEVTGDEMKQINVTVSIGVATKTMRMYQLREMPKDNWYDADNFREVDINISDIEVKEEAN
jgi:hypothetical protein